MSRDVKCCGISRKMPNSRQEQSGSMSGWHWRNEQWHHQVSDATNNSSQHLHQLSCFQVQMHSPSAKELSPEDLPSGWALYAFMDSAWDPAPTLFRTHSMTRLSPDDCASNNFNSVLVYGRSMLSNESRILTCTSVRVLESRPAVQLPFSAAQPCWILSHEAVGSRWLFRLEL